jgi:hypothetical protein
MWQDTFELRALVDTAMNDCVQWYANNFFYTICAIIGADHSGRAV